MAPVTGISALFHLIVIMLYKQRKVFLSLILIIGVILILGSNLPFAVRALIGKSSNLSRLTSVLQRYRHCDAITASPTRNIVLRFDDIQANSWKDSTIEIINHTTGRGIPMSVGIIPADLEKDPHLVSYLINNGCRLEFAQHGWDHYEEVGGNIPEFGRMTEQEAYTDIMKGKDLIERVLYRTPTTFLPPGNQYSEGTAAALNHAGFKVVSKEGTGRYDYDASQIDYTTDVRSSNADIVKKCSVALDADGLCVIMLHPQDFAYRSVLDEKLFADYTDLLDDLQSLNATFTTFEAVGSLETFSGPTVMSAWLTCCTDQDRAMESMRPDTDRPGTILPMWYWLDDSGRVYDFLGTRKNELTEFAKTGNISIMPSITNDFIGERVSALLASETIQDEEIAQLIHTAHLMGFIGWDLDWEEILESDRDAFTAFVEKFAHALHEDGLKLSVTVHAQTGKDSDWVGTRGQDLTAIAFHADEVRVMVYDYHHAESAPGPVTPMDWFEDVLTYSLSAIPKDKLVIALPTYGYDWSDGSAVSLQYDDAITTLTDNGGSWHRDPSSYELTGTYVVNDVRHDVWFEDGESASRKIDIARQHGVNRFTFWRLGGEDPLIWRR